MRERVTLLGYMGDVAVVLTRFSATGTDQSSGAVIKSRWTSWAPVPNKPTVSVDVKQHINQLQPTGADRFALLSKLLLCVATVGQHRHADPDL